MTLRHLKIFVTVCETGSTIAAAERLHIAQPSNACDILSPGNKGYRYVKNVMKTLNKTF